MKQGLTLGCFVIETNTTAAIRLRWAQPQTIINEGSNLSSCQGIIQRAFFGLLHEFLRHLPCWQITYACATNLVPRVPGNEVVAHLLHSRVICPATSLSTLICRLINQSKSIFVHRKETDVLANITCEYELKTRLCPSTQSHIHYSFQN